MRLVNSFDKEAVFDNLKEAKTYYLPSKEVDKDVRNKDNYSGDDFDGYVHRWEEYIDDLNNAADLSELCEVLNRNSDEFDNGSSWSIIE